MNKRIMAVFLIVVLFLNMTLLALGKISEIFFWVVIIFCAVGSYLIKKQNKMQKN